METITPTPDKSLALRHKLQPLLSDREELLWTGQPKQGIIFRGYDLFLVPFSFLWGGGLLLGVVGGMLDGFSGSDFPIFLLPIFFFFGLVAFYITIGRFLLDIYSRSKIVYGITNRRIIVQDEGIGGKTKSYDLKSLSNLSVEQGKDGRGTITIGASPSGRWMMRGFGFPGMNAYMPPALEQIPNAQQVYELIQDVRD
jgi:hypothetical protein